jgi:uncharacterized protein (TIGR00159 family)
MAAVAVLARFAIRYLRQSRASTALLGLALLGAVYAVATWLELRLMSTLFQAFFAALVIVLVVVFQDDLRRFFEQLGSWRPGRPAESDEPDTVSLLVRVVASLTAQRTGALIVLPQSEPIERHVEGGVVLGGRVSEPLLLSLFDPSSPGHDGAVILRGNVVERFAVHLPLSANRELLGSRGTRHAAALGLSERCDAICIVISEERGTVSIARDGELRTVHVQDLPVLLAADVPEPAAKVPLWRRGGWLEAAAAVGVAALLWVVFIPGSDVSELVVPAGVDVSNLPGDLALEAVEPAQVDVTLRGLRRDLVLADPAAVRVRVDAYLARLGRRTFFLSSADVEHPENLTVVDIEPERVRVSLRSAPPGEPQ